MKILLKKQFKDNLNPTLWLHNEIHTHIHTILQKKLFLLSISDSVGGSAMSY